MDIRQFIEKAKELGELKLIEGAHWDLEIGTINYVAARNPGQRALLFDKIQGYPEGYRLLGLSCLGGKRLNMVLGLPLELRGLDLVNELRKKLSKPLELLPPVEVKEGPIMQNIHTGSQVDLFEFPTPKWQALDGGRYIGTGDTVIVRDPDEGWVNVGVHRIQIHDKSTALMCIEDGKHVDMIRKKYWSRGQSCPAAVTLGGDPLNVLMAGNRIPWGMSEYDYMGWWRKKPVEVIRGPYTGLPIPADAEIVLEGDLVAPEVESRMEGPFSEWSGHYAPAKLEPAFRVKYILHRDDPILLGMLPFLGTGVPMEFFPLMLAANIWNHLDKLVPGVKGVWHHWEFGGPHAVAVSIEQKYGGHAKQVALATLGYLNYNLKFVFVVDEDIDPTSLSDVMFAVGMRSDPDRWDIVRDCWCGKLDPLLSPQKKQVGDITHSAAMILACKPYYWIKDFPSRVTLDPELVKKVREKWQDL